MSAEVESSNHLIVENVILGLGAYLSPVNFLLKKNLAMRHRIGNPRWLKVRGYTDLLIDLDEYLNFFPLAKLTDKFGVMELNEILLNSMPNSWSKQAYVQGFDCESITFKNDVKMFDRMESAQSIYKGVL